MSERIKMTAGHGGAQRYDGPPTEWYKITLRLPMDMDDAIREMADLHMRTYNATLVRLLDFALDNYQEPTENLPKRSPAFPLSLSEHKLGY